MTRLYRDAAREAIVEEWPYIEAILDALEGCIRSDPVQALDREALIVAVKQGLRDPAGRGESGDLYGAIADRILALLRPVEGVTLTREEADEIAVVLRGVSPLPAVYAGGAWPGSAAEAAKARIDRLAQRLEDGLETQP